MLDIVSEDLARLEREVVDSFADDAELARKPMRRLFEAGGKRLRPALVLLSARLGDYDYGRAAPAAAAVEIIHAATLVHDDLIDHSPTRRGVETVVATEGDARAIVIGDYYFARAYREASKCRDDRVVGVLAEAVMSICEGELRQQNELFRYRPGRYRYLRRIRLKTASLLEAACRAGGMLGGLDDGAVEALGKYALNLGLAFQIADDLLDYMGEEQEVGKPVGHDLLEGSATLPLMLACEDPDVAGELNPLLPDKTPLKAEEVARIVELVRESAAAKLTRAEADAYAGRARRALRALPGGVARDSLEALTEYVVGRST